MSKHLWKFGAGLALLAVTGLQAKVTEEEFAQLKANLSPVGAEIAANADGSIPAWSGGIKEIPEKYIKGEHYVDPYADDEVQYTVTKSNLDTYREFLSPGQIAMFDRYPDTWKMQVYPTRRSTSYPEFVYNAIEENATQASLTEDGNGVVETRVSSPFPIPKNGLEVIWNHLLRYRGEQVSREVVQAVPTASGSYQLVKMEEEIYFPYNKKEATLESINNRLGYFLQRVVSPPYLAGTLLLIHETLNQKEEARQAWTYNPGQRRVRRAPNVAYDNPGTASDGQRTTDQYDMFNGSPDRYDWKLVGKKELLIPYNSYKAQDGSIKYKDLIQAGHLNPEFLRYERHRVWVVEAQLKDGKRHIYPKKTYYIDEDSWAIVLADQYDAKDQIWRVSESHGINFYDRPFFFDVVQVHYDLANGRYLAFGMTNEGSPQDFTVELNLSDFTPNKLRRSGRR